MAYSVPNSSFFTLDVRDFDEIKERYGEIKGRLSHRFIDFEFVQEIRNFEFYNFLLFCLLVSNVRVKGFILIRNLFSFVCDKKIILISRIVLL